MENSKIVKSEFGNKVCYILTILIIALTLSWIIYVIHLNTLIPDKIKIVHRSKGDHVYLLNKDGIYVHDPNCGTCLELKIKKERN